LEDAVANRERVQRLNDSHGQVDTKVTYNLSLWQQVGAGPAFQVKVPARDFVTLVVE
jgi:hypothetical protein